MVHVLSMRSARTSMFPPFSDHPNSESGMAVEPIAWRTAALAGS